MDEVTAATRRALHGVAELLLAGPQYRRSGTIRLRVVPGGFGTVAEPDLRVEGAVLVAGDRRLPLAGTYAELGAAAGVDPGAPEGLYHDGSGAAPGDEITVDAAAAARLAESLAIGEEALLAFAPGLTPVLWPEHFDLAVTLDEVNYGISPGDGHLPEPYAYVGPWTPRTGPFWNAPFGASRPLRELGGAQAVRAFFEQGRTA
ncbi:hypothetical protein GCM10009530_11830 [Microbispora corallina]|uniref:Uncharacterized protein n=1 Tax=Microbispora corallina TaxID=83302 RepID=A0ABQ4FTG8_9ACTN|nr:hypothetical protein [Microbispora corallina]GIH38120.1 hypothetical protein Mco01_11200 [Microbispora corallina]